MAERFTSHWVHVPWQIVVASFCVYWYWHPPVPSKAVLILTGVTVVMALFDMRTSHKAVYVLLVICLMSIENRAINRDRTDATNAEEKRRKEENAQFQAIAGRLTASIQQSQVHFDVTMEKENAVLDQTKGVAELSQQNLAAVTGKDSLPCISPQSHAVVNGVVPLVVWNKGKNVLTGVEVRIYSQEEFLDQTSLFYKPPAELGTLRPEWPKPLPEGVTPKPDKDGVAHYIAEIWTQNGYYTQVINFRRGKYMLPWAYQYWLTHQVQFHPKGNKAIGMMGKTTKVCRQPEWSDDLGDGRPNPNPPS